MMGKLFGEGRWRIVLLLVVSVMVLGGGVYWWWAHTPLPLPATPEEGFAQVGSTRYANMPEYRQREYRAEIWRQVQELPEERRGEVRKLWEAHPEAAKEVRNTFMQDRARDYAMASPAERAVMDGVISMMSRRGGGPGGAGGGEGEGRHRWGGEEGEASTPEEQAQREARREERRREMAERLKEMFKEGNPQVNGWIGEFFKRHRETFERRRGGG